MTPVILPSLLLVALLLAAGMVWMRREHSRRKSLKGIHGERMVAAWLDRLDRRKYRVFHDLRIPGPDGRGRVQLDHVVVSQQGIHVIETRTSHGWVAGCRYDREWFQESNGKIRCFRNPLQRNQLHVMALAGWLGLPEMCFKNVVFFVGDARFKTAMPPNVVSRNHIDWLLKHPVRDLMPMERESAATLLERCFRDSARRAKRTRRSIEPSAPASVAA